MTFSVLWSTKASRSVSRYRTSRPSRTNFGPRRSRLHRRNAALVHCRTFEVSASVSNCIVLSPCLVLRSFTISLSNFAQDAPGRDFSQDPCTDVSLLALCAVGCRVSSAQSTARTRRANSCGSRGSPVFPLRLLIRLRSSLPCSGSKSLPCSLMRSS